ncbi:hypothetical protein DSLASN_24200 [Desulfoluna limicola]|uniref:DUF1573 domain-containing protein n=1 Tax=Desulfoluna limicola TaxID=2810562 RepID=A0ABM7PI91_9BACT|nr:hypothetical protein [Desulfoluna limicola]BCS96788.1 hypothetical protein DSLASN_24200 [Desulfoluna limicola]
MRSKTMIGLALLSTAILAVMALASLGEKEQKNGPNQKRAARFYTGIPEAPVRTRCTLTGPITALVLPAALQGDVVELTLIVPNPTDKALQLTKPKSCCGIIVTNLTPLVPPGEDGMVKTVIMTDKLGGKTLDAYVQVETTDPARPLLRFDASMAVTEFASLSQHKITLTGPHSEPVEGSSTVTPAEAYPFAITGIKAKKGLHVAYNVEEIKDTEGTRYLVRATNTRKTAGVYRDMLYLQTDNPLRPELRIRVEGHIE